LQLTRQPQDDALYVRSVRIVVTAVNRRVAVIRHHYTALRKEERVRSRSGKQSATETVTKVPTPGSPVRGSDTGRPIMALLDLLGRRWALRIIWELRQGELTFRELQASCGSISSSVLNDRLTELRAAGILRSGDGGYALTPEGRRLLDLYVPLRAWAARWAKRTKA
jgi:DNA-binding HxlR family transcriptional regulator